MSPPCEPKAEDGPWIIALHTSPDFDAIGAAWLLARFYFVGPIEYRFIPAGQMELAATAIVDTGGELDYNRLRFDHHQLTGVNAITSATLLVYEWLSARLDVPSIDYLEDLVHLINDCDLGRQGEDALTSRRLGIHALLSNFIHLGASDTAILLHGFSMLDKLAAGLKRRAEQNRIFANHIKYMSADGVFCAVEYASNDIVHIAHDRGADIVLFFNRDGIKATDGSTTYPIELWRRSGVKIDLGAIIAVHREDIPEFTAELSRWFLHPNGFFAGRGSRKSPVPHPIELDPIAFAAAFDRWRRRTIAALGLVLPTEDSHAQD